MLNSKSANSLLDEVKICETWQAYRGTIQTQKEKSEIRKILLQVGLKWGKKISMCFIILARMGRTKNIGYKKLQNYEETRAKKGYRLFASQQ
jgi:hypothetical protein